MNEARNTTSDGAFISHVVCYWKVPPKLGWHRGHMGGHRCDQPEVCTDYGCRGRRPPVTGVDRVALRVHWNGAGTKALEHSLTLELSLI